MIKKFEKFITEQHRIIPMKGAKIYAEDERTNKKYNVDVLETNIENIEDKFGRGGHQFFESTIYVMPDDSVEIMTITSDRHIQAKIKDLTGKDVRDNQLHRNGWRLGIILG